jgi:hypothetical protein
MLAGIMRHINRQLVKICDTALRVAYSSSMPSNHNSAGDRLFIRGYEEAKR